MNIFGFGPNNAGQFLSSTGGTLTGDLNMGGNAVTNSKELILVQNAAPDTPPVAALTLFADAGSLHYKDHAGAVVDLVGAPVCVDLYSAGASVVVANTAVETALAPAAGGIGAMTLQAPQPVGMAIALGATFIVSSAAGDTLTFRINSQAGTLATFVYGVGGGTFNLAVNLRASLTVRAATIASSIVIEDNTPNLGIISAATAAYNPLIQNTLTLTAQWGAALSSCEMQQALTTVHFR